MAQTVIIDSLIVSHVVVLTQGPSAENEEEGPIVTLFVTIKNDTDSTLVLYLEESEFLLKYKYNDCDYYVIVNPIYLIPFLKQDTVTLDKNEKFKLDFSKRIFLGTNILDQTTRKRYDYSKEMLQTIPTLQVIYKDPKHKIVSTGIRSVKLFDYEYTYE